MVGKISGKLRISLQLSRANRFPSLSLIQIISGVSFISGLYGKDILQCKTKSMLTLRFKEIASVQDIYSMDFWQY